MVLSAIPEKPGVAAGYPLHTEARHCDAVLPLMQIVFLRSSASVEFEQQADFPMDFVSLSGFTVPARRKV